MDPPSRLQSIPKTTEEEEDRWRRRYHGNRDLMKGNHNPLEIGGGGEEKKERRGGEKET